jgi:hypothetical protein
VLDEAGRATDPQAGAVYRGSNENLRLVQSTSNWNGDTRISVPFENATAQWGVLTLGPRRIGLDYSAQDCAALQKIANVTTRALGMRIRAIQRIACKKTCLPSAGSW